MHAWVNYHNTFCLHSTIRLTFSSSSKTAGSKNSEIKQTQKQCWHMGKNSKGKRVESEQIPTKFSNTHQNWDTPLGLKLSLFVEASLQCLSLMTGSFVPSLKHVIFSGNPSSFFRRLASLKQLSHFLQYSNSLHCEKKGKIIHIHHNTLILHSTENCSVFHWVKCLFIIKKAKQSGLLYSVVFFHQLIHCL